MSKIKEYKCPFTPQDLERLERNLAQGIKEVEYNDKRVVYRTFSEMQKAANYMRQKLGLSNRSSRNRGIFGGKRLTMRPSKGLNNCSGNEHGEDERLLIKQWQ